MRNIENIQHGINSKKREKLFFFKSIGLSDNI